MNNIYKKLWKIRDEMIVADLSRNKPEKMPNWIDMIQECIEELDENQYNQKSVFSNS
ncbi:MAG: hypothetical protein JXB48_21110 [Candidatus Latescibacteria bacterium]|nr:hypothetical protein [Candidatus Latescibacterota bacterium]